MNAIEKYLSEKWDSYNGEPDLFGLTSGGFNGNSDLNIADFDKEQLDWASSFASACGEPIQTINKKHTSNGLKHIAERWAKKVSCGEINYISNGNLILAMVDAGFRFQRDGNSPNVYFNVSERAIKWLIKHNNQ